MAPRWLSESELGESFDPSQIDRLADRDGDGTPDVGIVAAAIERAESRAESRLRIRFAAGDLPTTPETTSKALKRVVAGLTWWELHQGHSLIGDAVRDVHQAALSELSDLSRGQASTLLAGEPAVDNATPLILQTRTRCESRFRREVLDRVL